MSDYYFREDSIAEQQRSTFERLWRDEYIHAPPLDNMPREQFEQLKEWAWKLFKNKQESSGNKEKSFRDV